ncbi:MAG: hypothetical protein NVV82_08440 [Sporocytophaga sp.]|nr:hypothetical protein [Sporocytophaga sp.]
MRFKIQSFLRPDILLYLIVLGLLFLVIKVRGLVADIQLHDTYYVVEYSYFIYPCIILFAIEGLIYSAFIFLKKHPNYILSLIYFIVSIVAVAGLISSMLPLVTPHLLTRRYYAFTEPLYVSTKEVTFFLIIFFLSKAIYGLSLVFRRKGAL